MGVFAKKGRLYYRFQIDGQSYSGPTDLGDTPRNRTKAAQIEATQRQKISEGRVEKKVEHRLFSQVKDEFVTWLKSEHHEKPNTWKRICGSLTSLVLFFGRKPILAIDIGDVQSYMQWRREEHKVKEVTLRHDLHNLSVFFSWAKVRGYARTNIIHEAVDDELLTMPSDKDAVREHVLTAEEERTLFRFAASRPHLSDSCHIMIEQGLRPEEAWSLEKRGFDAERRTFQIYRGKSNAAKRTLHCTPEVYTILLRRLPGQSPWFFPSPRNPKRHLGPMNNTFYRTLANANKDRQGAKLHLTMYDLRHTFATRAGESGMDIKTLADILGHANLRTVARYIHPTDDHKKAAMDRLEKYKAQLLAQADARANTDQQQSPFQPCIQCWGNGLRVAPSYTIRASSDGNGVPRS